MVEYDLLGAAHVVTADARGDGLMKWAARPTDLDARSGLALEAGHAVAQIPVLVLTYGGGVLESVQNDGEEVFQRRHGRGERGQMESEK